MRNIVILIVITVVVGIVTALIAKHFHDETVKMEIGVYPKDFKEKVYDKMEKWVKDLFLYNFVGSLINIPYQTGLTELSLKPVMAQKTPGNSWNTDWSLSMASSLGLEEGKDYGIGKGGSFIEGRFWILPEHLPAFQKAVEDNHRFIMQTKGIELSNNIYYRYLKTLLENDFGIDIENPYFKKLFDKYNTDGKA